MWKSALVVLIVFSNSYAQETLKLPNTICPEGFELGEPRYAHDGTTIQILKDRAAHSKWDEAAYKIAIKGDGTAKRWLLNFAFDGIWAATNPELIYRVETKTFQGWAIRSCEAIKND